MSATNLPDAQWQAPACGACYAETNTEDGDYVCYSCGLLFDEQTLEARYHDDGAEPCGAPCENTWHGPERIKAGWTHACNPCALPEGHESRCWTGCDFAEIPEEESSE